MTSVRFAPRFARSPLAWLAACFIAGIVCSEPLLKNSLFPAVCALGFFGLTILLRKKKFAFWLLWASFLFLGAFCRQVERESVKPNRLKNLYDSAVFASGEPVEIAGFSLGRAESSVGGFFLFVEAEKLTYKEQEQSVSGKIRIFAPFRDEETKREYTELGIESGTKLKILCELRREERFLNPGAASTREILDSQRIDAVCTLKSPLLLEVSGKKNGFFPLGRIYEQRQILLDEFRTRFSPQTAGILIASLLGNRYYLDKETSKVFREGGTFHILVISGLQITFIGGILIWIFRLLTKNRLSQFIFSSVVLWIYAVAVGADAPVVRAALMFTILHFAFVIYRAGNLLNALGASALILLVWQPSEIYNQSFQLTFLCVLAIVGAAFPLLEKMRAIGEWRPTIETPVPPQVSANFKKFCEILYWSESAWRIESSRHIWKCVLFKTELAEKLERLRLQKILRYIFETLTVSLIVQLWLLPLSIIYFHRISLISVFLNIWVGLLMAIESLTALTGILIAQISEIPAAPFIRLTEILSQIIFGVTAFLVESDWSSLRLPHYSRAGKIVYLLYFATLCGLATLIKRWKPFALMSQKQTTQTEKSGDFTSRFWLKTSAATFLISFVIIVFHPFSAPPADGNLRLDFLDVGQGDAAFLTLPAGETILIDGGGRANFNKIYIRREGEEPEIFEPDVQSIGEMVVSKFLWEKGYDTIDYLLPTHADTDHIQGLTDVAKNFRINGAILSRKPANDSDFQDFYEVLKERNIPVQLVSRGDVLNFGEIEIEILHPQPETFPDGKWENNQSTVVRIIYGEVQILMTGDIEKETERELLRFPEFLEADIVKVPHHGSKTSSVKEFVEAVKAKIAIISVGRESPFGHPKPEVVERWQNTGAEVLTTGEKGTVTITTNGKRLAIERFVK